MDPKEPFGVANIVIAVCAFLATAASAVAALFSYITTKNDLENKKYQWAAELEKLYHTVRLHNRAVRQKIMESKTRTSLEIAVRYFQSTTGRGDVMDEADKERIGQAMDECASIWENVVVQLQAGLLPDNFFSDGQEWQIRASKYIKEMEPMEIANWYRYRLTDPSNNMVTDMKDLYSYMEGGVHKHRPRRYRVLADRLAGLPDVNLPAPGEVEERFCNRCGIHVLSPIPMQPCSVPQQVVQPARSWRRASGLFTRTPSQARNQVAITLSPSPAPARSRWRDWLELFWGARMSR